MHRHFFNTLLIILFATGVICAKSKDYSIHSAAELAALNLQPGDRVVLQPGDWSNQQLIFKGSGTKDAPIILTSAVPGHINLSGNSGIVIDGEWLVVDGLSFAKGGVIKNDVITFGKKSKWCRLTNTTITDFNTADKRQPFAWIVVNGTHNRVDHCYTRNKINRGPTLVVTAADDNEDNQIDHNFFDVRPDAAFAGRGETIKIGQGNGSAANLHTVVEYNIFYRCNGSPDVVTIKANNNFIGNNLFFECAGVLSLRYGNNSQIYGNYFVGNGTAGGGGIRISGKGHRIQDNYLQSLTGTGLSPAIGLMNGSARQGFNDYLPVKAVKILNNTIVNCKSGIEIGSGKAADRNIRPARLTIMDNLIWGTPPIIYTDMPKGLRIDRNIVFSIQLSADLPEGFDMTDPALRLTPLNIYQPEKGNKTGAPGITAMQKQLFDAQGIGPLWLKNIPPIVIK